MKGQVTIFIIVGIFLLLMITGAIFFLSPDDLTRGELLRDTVPSEYSPVQLYVEGCLDQVGERAVRILGERGGYLFTENDNYLSYQAFGLDAKTDAPTDADAFFLNPSVVVPYWYYMKSPNAAKGSYEFSSNAPDIQSNEFDGSLRAQEAFGANANMEAMIDRYVNTYLEICLQSFGPLTDGGMNIQAQQPQVTTFITENDVILNLHMPTNITLEGRSQRIDNYASTLPVRLKDMHELGELIVRSQVESQFLETHILTMIVYYSGVDRELAPMSQFTFEFGGQGTTWTTQQLEQSLSNIITSNTQPMQVQGSNNYNPVFLFPTDPGFQIRKDVYDNMVLPMVDIYPQSSLETNLDVSDIRLQSLDWPIYFDVNDDGGIVKAEVVGIDAINIGFQKYEALYDVSWPVLVSMNDRSAFNGEGFIFNIGLEGNIRNNRAVTPDGEEFELLFDNAPDVCEALHRNKTVHVTVQDDNCVFGNEITCNPVNEAALLFQVGPRSCTLGITNATGEADVKIPSGVLGAFIFANHPDYLSEGVQHSPEAIEYTIKGMREYNNVTIEAKKVRMQKNNNFWEPAGAPQDISPEEEVIFTFTRIDREGDDGDQQTTVTIPSENQVIDLVDGDYNVNGYLFGADDPALAGETLRYLSSLDFDELNANADENTTAAIQNIQNNQQFHTDAFLASTLNELLEDDSTTYLQPDFSSRSIIGGISFVEDADGTRPLHFARSEMKSASTITLYVFEFENAVPVPVDEIPLYTRIYEQEMAHLIE